MQFYCLEACYVDLSYFIRLLEAKSANPGYHQHKDFLCLVGWSVQILGENTVHLTGCCQGGALLGWLVLSYLWIPRADHLTAGVPSPGSVQVEKGGHLWAEDSGLWDCNWKSVASLYLSISGSLKSRNRKKAYLGVLRNTWRLSLQQDVPKILYEYLTLFHLAWVEAP